MKNYLTIFLNISLLLLATAAGAKEVVNTFKWSPAAQQCVRTKHGN